MATELENATNVENTETKPEAKQTDLDKRIKELEAENNKLRQSVTNASADASRYKKELQAKMTEEEKANADREAATAAMQQELEMLRTERNVANHKSQLVSIGFEDALAQETAEAINNGDTAKLFDGIRKFLASHDRELQTRSIMSNPTIKGGGEVKKSITKAEFDKMGYTDRLRIYNEDRELYKELTK